MSKTRTKAPNSNTIRIKRTRALSYWPDYRGTLNEGRNADKRVRRAEKVAKGQRAKGRKS